MAGEPAGIVKTIEALNQRLEKAKELAHNGKVRKIEGTENWVVQNSDESKIYLVQDSICTCPDFHQRKELHKGWCKHRLAVVLAQQAAKETKLTRSS